MSTAPGNSSNTATWNEPEVTDNNGAPNVTRTNGLPSGSNFESGTTHIRYEATDSAGNVATCEFTVNIIDDESPVFSDCPDSITNNTIPGAVNAIIQWTAPTPTDNVGLTEVDGGQLYICNYNPGSLFGIGSTVVTCTAKDESNNTGTCEFNVQIIGMCM
ncbi:hyalin-like [Anneissia japonica]|uniref:hyalin-like n=1 Tax=Anneissia japonica TaxID=1529436 RepID=UPI001425712B|nr:hyalin-like [Anneissia japonica]